MVARVGAAANETMLIEVADFGRNLLRERCADGDQVAHPVKAALPLKTCGVEVQEGLIAEDQGRLRALCERNRIFDVGPQPQAGPADVAAPALLASQPEAELARAELGDIVEGDLFPCAMLHRGEVAGRILRVM